MAKRQTASRVCRFTERGYGILAGVRAVSRVIMVSALVVSRNVVSLRIWGVVPGEP